MELHPPNILVTKSQAARLLDFARDTVDERSARTPGTRGVATPRSTYQPAIE